MIPSYCLHTQTNGTRYGPRAVLPRHTLAGGAHDGYYFQVYRRRPCGGGPACLTPVPSTVSLWQASRRGGRGPALAPSVLLLRSVPGLAYPLTPHARCRVPETTTHNQQTSPPRYPSPASR